MSLGITAAEAAKIATSNRQSVKELIDEINHTIRSVAKDGSRLASLTYQKDHIDLSHLEEAKIALENLGFQVEILTDNPSVKVNTIQVRF